MTLMSLAIASLVACEDKDSAAPRPAEAGGADPAGAPTTAAAEPPAAGAGGSTGDTFSETAPADFPIPIPAGVKGQFGSSTEDGLPTRFALFKLKGGGADFAVQCEKVIRGRGLEPTVHRSDLGVIQVVKIEARKGDIEITANVVTDKSGESQVAISWREPAR